MEVDKAIEKNLLSSAEKELTCETIMANVRA